MRKPLLYLTALLFFAYEQVAFYQWMKAHGTVAAGLAHAWSTLRADPMVFMAWNDMGIFTVLVLIWFARELVARKHSLLWWPATLIFGCPPLLIYLARYGGPQRGTTDSTT
jgi:Terpene cyclase DEP1